MDDLKKIIGDWPGGKILDMATGSGEFIPYLQVIFPRLDNIIGVDLSQPKIRQARRRYRRARRTTFAVMDGEMLGIKTGSFDTASITNSLHHLKDVNKVLYEMKRALKPGGMLLIFEMFSDHQSEKQMSHVMAHHWWAEIDRLTGYLHNETFPKDRLLDIVKKVGLQKQTFVELEDTDAVDEPALNRVRFTIDDYLKKLENMGNHESLRERGHEIRERLDKIGFAWAKLLGAVGYK